MIWGGTLMSCLSGSYNSAKGILLQVGICPGGTLANAKNLKPGQSTDSLKGRMLNGLVDTGAEKTCISSTAAQSIQLSPVSKISMQGATGYNQMNQYRIDLVLQLDKVSVSLSNFLVIEHAANSAFF